MTACHLRLELVFKLREKYSIRRGEPRVFAAEKQKSRLKFQWFLRQNDRQKQQGFYEHFVATAVDIIRQELQRWT